MAWLSSLAGGIGGAVGSVGSAIGSAASTVGSGIGQAVSGIGKGVGQLGQSFHSGVGKGTGLWDVAPTGTGEKIKTIAGGIQNVQSPWSKVGSALGQYAGNYLKQQYGQGVPSGPDYSQGGLRKGRKKSVEELIEEMSGRS